MTAAILMATVAAAAMVLLTRGVLRDLPLASTTAPHTALEHAEAILASRYARGHINAQEYQRTLAVLRR